MGGRVWGRVFEGGGRGYQAAVNGLFISRTIHFPRSNPFIKTMRENGRKRERELHSFNPS